MNFVKMKGCWYLGVLPAGGFCHVPRLASPGRGRCLALLAGSDVECSAELNKKCFILMFFVNFSCIIRMMFLLNMEDLVTVRRVLNMEGLIIVQIMTILLMMKTPML